jgi:His-Xaa-Ser system radical SAM maturase HxsC
MEHNVTLALRGAATDVRGFETNKSSRVIRLCNPARTPDCAADVALLVSAEDVAHALQHGYDKALSIGLSSDSTKGFSNLVTVPSLFSYLREGDIVALHPSNKRIRTLHRNASLHNFFFVTERCNNYCLMCSQPPRDVDDGWLLDEIKEAVPLVGTATKSFGFTGGEPLTDWRGLIGVLHECKRAHPTTAVHVLTNGRAFASTEVSKAWAGIGHHNLTAGIPIYSAIDHVHDYVVQAQGAFDETILGVLKLKDAGQRVEVRVVLHAITAPRIIETAHWLARNLPFVDHVALMGLENTGFAIANDPKLWIDPIDFREDLATAVEILAGARMNVSIYNLTRCVLAPSSWPYAVRSISDWKNAYLPACEPCVEKNQCAGFFTTGRPRYSRAIQPFLSETNVRS